MYKRQPWHRYFTLPAWLSALISKGALGQKSGAGVYRKAGREIQVLDLQAQDYRPSAGKLADEVAALLKERDPAKRFAALRASEHPQAQFLWSLFRDIFHYSAAQLGQVADNARDLDLAMRWGFGWAQGPVSYTHLNRPRRDLRCAEDYFFSNPAGVVRDSRNI